MIALLAFGDAGWGDEMVRGAVMTVLLAAAAYVLGLAIGMVGAAAKVWGGATLRTLAEIYTTVVRGVPELLVIYLLFFGNEAALNWIAGLFGYTGTIRLNEFATGMIAVGIISGGYSTEVFRGAIRALPKGQIEAARAFGMGSGLTFRRIMLPQILRLALPGLGNVWQLILKDTALVSVVGLAEIMRVANVAARSEHEPFLFYIVAALLYLVITSASGWLFRAAETHFGRGERPVLSPMGH